MPASHRSLLGSLVRSAVLIGVCGAAVLFIRQRVAGASPMQSGTSAESAAVQDRIGTVLGNAFYARAWPPPIEDSEAGALLRKMSPNAVLPDVQTAHQVVHGAKLGYIASDMLTFENTSTEQIPTVVSKLDLSGAEPYTHWASALTSAGQGRWTGIVMVGRKLPLFDPLRMSGPLSQHFVDTCPACGDVHQLITLATSRVTKIGCPRCGRNSAMIAKGGDGKYRFLGDFLTPWEGAPLADLPQGDAGSWLAGMIRTIRNTCQYSEDTGRRGTADDIFQTALETIESGCGDCEDSSILLCDWLTALGFKAKVACGTAGRERQGSGHAWVLLELRDQWFVLETTGSHSHPNGIIPMREAVGEYKAEMLFDKDSLYVPVGDQGKVIPGPREGDGWKAFPRREGTTRPAVDVAAVTARLRQLTLNVRPQPVAER